MKSKFKSTSAPRNRVPINKASHKFKNSNESVAKSNVSMSLSVGDLFKNSGRVVCGTHALRELLLVRPKGVVDLWLKKGWESSQELRELQEMAYHARIKISEQPSVLLDKVNAYNQGAVAFVSKDAQFTPQWKALIDSGWLERQRSSILLFLDGLEDPHNLGAILRTSWLMSVHGVFIPKDRAVGLTPAVHKVACGGVEHVPVVETGSFAQPIEDLKRQGYWVFGLSHKGKKTIYELDLPEKVIWMVGAEDKGLRTTSERLCDELIRIPQQSASASYNASVAVAMALCETSRQHSLKSL